jgi:23S rRNA pseudouridine1911/1915/1917 synthase
MVLVSFRYRRAPADAPVTVRAGWSTTSYGIEVVMAELLTPHTHVNLDVQPEHAGQRLDQFLRSVLPHVSRAALRELFSQGHIRIRGQQRRAIKSASVAEGDVVEVSGVVLESGPAPDTELALEIVHEDRWLIAVDKPGGVPSHALRAGERGTVVSALLARYPELRGVGYRELESGLLHRLDNETSGILLAARDQASFELLQRAHVRGEFSKRYLALVAGHPVPHTATAFLDAERRKVTVRSQTFGHAKPIVSQVLSSTACAEFSLVCVQVALAARHQVRAHLAHLGHPIAGDRLYGGPQIAGLERHFLHASELEFPHPVHGTRLRLRAELPEELRAVLRSLDGGRGSE